MVVDIRGAIGKYAAVWLATLTLAVGAAACGGQSAAEQTIATPAPIAPTALEPTAVPQPTPAAAAEAIETRGMEIYTGFVGAGTPSIEERIYLADVVVRARLQSSASSTLTFQAIEYLKGSGAGTFVVNITPGGRNPQWDGQEAVLFLSGAQSGGAVGQSEGASAAFEFTDTTTFDYSPGREYFLEATAYTGDLPEGHSLGTRNPVWLPASQPATQASGAAGSSGGSTATTTYMVGSPDAPVTLAELKAKIAWVEGGNGNAEYEECVEDSLAYIRHIRDMEADLGEPITIPRFDYAMASGLGKGHEITDFGTHSWPEYDQVWLSEGDTSLFTALNVDDDTVPSNGYRSAVQTARPLPAGVYEFTYKEEPPIYSKCNFDTAQSGLTYVVTVTAPDGTLHEAFFDPATTTAGVGYSTGATTTGVLKPAAFSVDGRDTTITGLKWEDGSVVLSLSPFVSLGDNQLSFIGLDGSFAFAFGASAATADSAAGTLTWAEADRPWSAGDQLMLRIGPGPDPAPATRSIRLQSPGDTWTISWGAVAGASGYRVQYRTGRAGEWTGLPATTGTSRTFGPQDGLLCGGTTYQFRVQARGDGKTYNTGWGAPSSSLSKTTGACNQPPVFSTSTYAFSVAEDAATSTVAGTVSATDPDGDALTYSIASGNDGGAFSIDGSGGSIAVAVPLDYETKASYTLTVEARDGRANGTADATVHISVTDATEPPPPAPRGVNLALSGDTFAISWSAVNGADRYRAQHRTGGSGEWTNLDATASTTQAFSPQGGVACETTHEFRVQARGDGTTHLAQWGQPSEVVSHTTGTCNLPPVFSTSTYAFSVAENTAKWSTAGIVSATDPDGDVVTYSIASGNEAGKFNVDGFSGEILVWSALDFETESSYTLTVEARDGKANGTARATVVITITDVAD